MMTCTHLGKKSSVAMQEGQISSCERVDEGKPPFRRKASAADPKILGRTACIGTTANAAPINKFTECEDEFSRTKCTRTLTYFGCGPGPTCSLVLPGYCSENFKEILTHA